MLDQLWSITFTFWYPERSSEASDLAHTDFPQIFLHVITASFITIDQEM